MVGKRSASVCDGLGGVFCFLLSLTHWELDLGALFLSAQECMCWRVQLVAAFEEVQLHDEDETQ